MNCYDCEIQGRARPAVAVCHDCGAAVCAEHTSVTQHHLTKVHALNMPVPIDPPQRRLRCKTCTDAVVAAR